MLNHDPVEKHLNMAWRTSLRAGFIASGLLLFSYSLVVWLSSGSAEHILDLVREDGAFVAAITMGFGVQIALYSYLKRGMHHVSRSASVVGGVRRRDLYACHGGLLPPPRYGYRPVSRPYGYGTLSK